MARPELTPVVRVPRPLASPEVGEAWCYRAPRGNRSPFCAERSTPRTSCGRGAQGLKQAEGTPPAPRVSRNNTPRQSCPPRTDSRLTTQKLKACRLSPRPVPVDSQQAEGTGRASHFPYKTPRAKVARPELTLAGMFSPTTSARVATPRAARPDVSGAAKPPAPPRAPLGNARQSGPSSTGISAGGRCDVQATGSGPRGSVYATPARPGAVSRGRPSRTDGTAW